MMLSDYYKQEGSHVLSSWEVFIIDIMDYNYLFMR